MILGLAVTRKRVFGPILAMRRRSGGAVEQSAWRHHQMRTPNGSGPQVGCCETSRPATCQQLDRGSWPCGAARSRLPSRALLSGGVGAPRALLHVSNRRTPGAQGCSSPVMPSTGSPPILASGAVGKGTGGCNPRSATRAGRLAPGSPSAKCRWHPSIRCHRHSVSSWF